MSIAALRPPRRRLEPAAQPASPAASILSNARRLLTALAVRMHIRRQWRATVAALDTLSDRELQDIGIEQFDSRLLICERHRMHGYGDWRSHDHRY